MISDFFARKRGSSEPASSDSIHSSVEPPVDIVQEVDLTLEPTASEPSKNFSSASTLQMESVSSTSFRAHNKTTVPSDLNAKSPSQPRLEQYKKTIFGSVERSFSSKWYNDRPWLEYSIENDAAYCFPCRVYGVNSNANPTVFTETGYRNWKNALDGWSLVNDFSKNPSIKKTLKGFAKHVLSSDHIVNFSLWKEKNAREATGKTISNIAVRLENETKQWIEVIFTVVRHLAAEGQPFRGDTECRDIEAGISGGLFLNTIRNVVFKLQPEIEEIASRIPRNAKYLSDDIQNEFIQVMADMVRKEHATKIKRSVYYTIMADGTTDKNNEEIQGVIVRFFSLETFQIEELTLNVSRSGRTAKEIFKFVKETLEESGVGFDGLVSQAFDGANVMSGERGGVQALINAFCDRIVPYIHCFCHRLHLVVEFVMSNECELKDLFDTMSGLYKFFKLAAVKESYSGTSLKRLIDTRWSGHFASCKSVNDNYDEIKKTLIHAEKNKKLDRTERAMASGFQEQISSDEFIFLNHFVLDILKQCDIANKILQSSKENLNSAMYAIHTVRELLKEKRVSYDDVTIQQIINEKKTNTPTIPRTTRVPGHLQDYILTEPLPTNDSKDLRRVVVECLDMLENDFCKRFSSENTVIWNSMEGLLPSSENFLDLRKLEPLFNYAMTVPAFKMMMQTESLGKFDLEAECHIFRRILTNQKEEFIHDSKNRQCIDLNKVCTFMVRNHEISAPVLTSLYRIAVTAGYSSARVESLFSAVTKIDAPQRRKMTTKRETNLSFLYFEKKTLMNLKFEDFIKVWMSKPRRLSFH